MNYKNIKTGAVIDSSSIITGDNWEKVEEKKPVKKKETRKDKE